jgi:hypothetical protein
MGKNCFIKKITKREEQAHRLYDIQTLRPWTLRPWMVCPLYDAPMHWDDGCLRYCVPIDQGRKVQGRNGWAPDWTGIGSSYNEQNVAIPRKPKPNRINRKHLPKP